MVVRTRMQPLHEAFVRSLGIARAGMQYVAVEAAAHFRSGFERTAGSIHAVAAAALHAHDFARLAYRRRRRMYPLELTWLRGVRAVVRCHDPPFGCGVWNVKRPGPASQVDRAAQEPALEPAHGHQHLPLHPRDVRQPRQHPVAAPAEHRPVGLEER